MMAEHQRPLKTKLVSLHFTLFKKDAFHYATVPYTEVNLEYLITHLIFVNARRIRSLSAEPGPSV